GMVKIKGPYSTSGKNSGFSDNFFDLIILLIKDISTHHFVFFISLFDIYPMVIGSNKINGGVTGEKSDVGKFRRIREVIEERNLNRLSRHIPFIDDALS